MNQDFSLFEQRLIEAGYDSDAIEQILEVAKNSIYPKKYGLVWEEKKEMIKENLKLQIPYLEELEEREIKLVEPNSPQHLLIEGDNYEALKLLQTTHRGKVNVIYIDPPYNTGNNDFIYNDRIVDKEDSYRHSKWLSFMHKRLILAKELMSEDGVVFISIDDNEMAQLKLLCDEVFGEKNKISTTVWKKKNGGGNDSIHIATEHEYILVYAKNKKDVCAWKEPYDEKYLKRYKEIDNNGRFFWDTLARPGLKNPLIYEITAPDGTKLLNGWSIGEKTFKERLAENKINFKKTKNGWSVQFKQYLSDGKKPRSILVDKATTADGKKEIVNIFNSQVFSYPKPLNLIKYLCNLVPNKNAIILDFFAGSGTTGHAVLELNQEDGGNRQFILCTNNENNICEDVTYERLKRVMNGYTAPKGKEVEGLPANLKYLKVGMIEKETYTDEDLSYLYIPHVLPLLQLKHNAFTLVSETKHGWVFEDEGFRFGLADPLATKRDFDQLKEHLESYEGEKILYLFSTDTKSYPKYKQLASLEEFIKPIPREMLELLKGE